MHIPIWAEKALRRSSSCSVNLGAPPTLLMSWMTAITSFEMEQIGKTSTCHTRAGVVRTRTKTRTRTRTLQVGRRASKRTERVRKPVLRSTSALKRRSA